MDSRTHATVTETPRARPVPLRTRTPLVAATLPGRSRRLVVSIAGVGRRRDGVPPNEFFGTAHGGGENHVLFLADPTRSWLNTAGLLDEMADLVAARRRALGIDEVVALGNSMGGFAAIRLAEAVRIDAVIAFAPQYSMHPDCVPEERRWRDLVARIDAWRVRDAGAMAAPGTRYVLFHGDHPQERPQYSRFPGGPAVRHYLLHGLRHNLAAVLRRRGALGPVVEAAVAGKPRQVRRRLERAFPGGRVRVSYRDGAPVVAAGVRTATGAPAEATRFRSPA